MQNTTKQQLVTHLHTTTLLILLWTLFNMMPMIKRVCLIRIYFDLIDTIFKYATWK